MKLMLISNSVQHGFGYLDHCETEIREFLEGCTSLTFIPFALHDWDAYTAKVADRFSSLGIEVHGIHESGSPKLQIAQSEAVFTGGGNTFRLLRRLYDFGLIETIRARVLNGVPYMGSSAGTNIACPTIKTTNDMPIVHPPALDALALVPFNINPHYLDPDPGSTHKGETREQRIQEYHEENENPVLGLREGTWLRRDGTRLRLLGTSGARLFRKNEAAVEFPGNSDLSFLLD